MILKSDVCNIFFNVLINLLATIDLSSLSVEYILKLLSCCPDFIYLFCLVHVLWSHPKLPILSSKGTTFEFLLKIKIKNNKSQNPSLYLFISCISSRSVLQVLSLKAVYTFLFSNFWITGLYSFPANCQVEIILLLFHQKVFCWLIYNLLKPVYIYINHVLFLFCFFAILNGLSRNTSSEDVLLGNSLKPP